MRKMFWGLYRIKLHLNLGTTKVQFNTIFFNFSRLAEPFVRVAETKLGLEYDPKMSMHALVSLCKRLILPKQRYFLLRS